jgi:hypothetical protein
MLLKILIFSLKVRQKCVSPPDSILPRCFARCKDGVRVRNDVGHPRALFCNRSSTKALYYQEISPPDHGHFRHRLQHSKSNQSVKM